MAKQYGIQFFETSAKDQLNIDELFITTTKDFLEKQTNNKNTKNAKNNRNTKGMISIDDIKEPKKSTNNECC